MSSADVICWYTRYNARNHAQYTRPAQSAKNTTNVAGVRMVCDFLFHFYTYSFTFT